MLQRSPSYVVSLPVARTDRAPAAAPACRERRRLRDRALEERAARHALLPRSRNAAGAGARDAARSWRRSELPAGYDVERAFQRRTTIRGTSALCLVPDGDLFAAMQGRQRVDRHRHGSRRFTETGHRAGIRRRARGRHRRHRDRASTCGCSAASRSSVDGAPVERRRALQLQGHDAERRAQSGAVASAIPMPRGR